MTASAGGSLACHAAQMSPNSLKSKHFNSFAGTFPACVSANWAEKKTFPLRSFGNGHRDGGRASFRVESSPSAQDSAHAPRVQTGNTLLTGYVKGKLVFRVLKGSREYPDPNLSQQGALIPAALFALIPFLLFRFHLWFQVFPPNLCAVSKNTLSLIRRWRSGVRGQTSPRKRHQLPRSDMKVNN